MCEEKFIGISGMLLCFLMNYSVLINILSTNSKVIYNYRLFCTKDTGLGVVLN